MSPFLKALLILGYLLVLAGHGTACKIMFGPVSNVTSSTAVKGLTSNGTAMNGTVASGSATTGIAVKGLAFNSTAANGTALATHGSFVNGTLASSSSVGGKYPIIPECSVSESLILPEA